MQRSTLLSFRVTASITQLLLLHLHLQVRFSGPAKHAGLASSPSSESGDLLAFQSVISEL